MANHAAEKLTFPAGCYRRSAGFTLLEILVTLAVVAILVAISIPVYNGYIDKATLAVATNTMGATRKALENYYIDNGGYPQTIDFTSGLDGQGREVLPPDLLGDFRSSIFSVESYVASTNDYTLTVRARDAKHTLLTLTNHRITQGT